MHKELELPASPRETENGSSSGSQQQNLTPVVKRVVVDVREERALSKSNLLYRRPRIRAPMAAMSQAKCNVDMYDGGGETSCFCLLLLLLLFKKPSGTPLSEGAKHPLCAWLYTAFFFFRFFFPFSLLLKVFFLSFFFFPWTSLGQSTAPSNLPFSYTTLGAAWFRCMLGCLQVSWHSSYKGLPPPLP